MGGGALYVCFMGTKQLRDILVDANLQKALLWADDLEISQLAGVWCQSQNSCDRSKYCCAQCPLSQACFAALLASNHATFG